MVILPTGGGKTLCWAARALSEQSRSLEQHVHMKVTVVLIPLISLLQEQLKRCISEGLHAASWNERYQPGVSVIIASIEVVRTEEYSRFITAMAARGLLAIIVIDEVHLLKLWEHFRHFESLAGSVRPSDVVVPLLLLSATIPREIVPGILKIVGADDSCLKIIRSDVGRPNIRFSVISVPGRDEKLLARAADFIEQKRKLLGAKERIIVFCLTVEDAVLLQQHLLQNMEGPNAHLYHGKMCGEKQWKSYRNWVDANTCQVMIGTAAFSCGIDYKYVRFVIHAGGSRTLLEFAQEIGRGGRDGKHSESVVLYNWPYIRERTVFNPESDRSNAIFLIQKRVSAAQNGEHDKNIGSFYTFAECKAGCRRAILEGFLNGSTRDACKENEVPCDLCDGSRSNATQGNERVFFRRWKPDDAHRNNEHIVNHETEFRNVQGSSCRREESMEVRTRPFTLPYRMNDEYVNNLMWMAKELSMIGCAVCALNENGPRSNIDHKVCVREQCFRCMDFPALHQSRDCEVVPRTRIRELRCYFCGIPNVKRCHEAKDYNRSSCHWLIVKNMSLILWKSDSEHERFLQAIPHLIPCNTAEEACRVLCGGVQDSEVTVLFAAVQYLHSRYIAERT